MTAAPKVGDVVEATVTGTVYDATPGGVVYLKTDNGARVAFSAECGATYTPAPLKVEPRDVWVDASYDLWIVDVYGKLRMVGGNGGYLTTDGDTPSDVSSQWGPLTLLVRDGKAVSA